MAVHHDSVSIFNSPSGDPVSSSEEEEPVALRIRCQQWRAPHEMDVTAAASRRPAVGAVDQTAQPAERDENPRNQARAPHPEDRARGETVKSMKQRAGRAKARAR